MSSYSLLVSDAVGFIVSVVVPFQTSVNKIVWVSIIYLGFSNCIRDPRVRFIHEETQENVNTLKNEQLDEFNNFLQKLPELNDFSSVHNLHLAFLDTKPLNSLITHRRLYTVMIAYISNCYFC